MFSLTGHRYNVLTSLDSESLKWCLMFLSCSRMFDLERDETFLVATCLPCLRAFGSLWTALFTVAGPESELIGSHLPVVNDATWKTCFTQWHVLH